MLPSINIEQHLHLKLYTSLHLKSHASYEISNLAKVISVQILTGLWQLHAGFFQGNHIVLLENKMQSKVKL